MSSANKMFIQFKKIVIRSKHVIYLPFIEKHSASLQ